MVFAACMLCGRRFIKTKEELVVCLTCYKRICKGKCYYSKNKTHTKYNLTISEYKLLTESCTVCNGIEFIVVHHIVPKSRGGKDCFENYLGLCQTCYLLIHMRKVPLARLLWCRNKSIQGVRIELKNERNLLENKPDL